MPELPEVETIRRDLLRAIKGKTFKNFWTNWSKKVLPQPTVFLKKIKGKKIINIDRQAKILIIKLVDGNSIAIHLKLTGQLIYQPRQGRALVGGHPQKGGLQNLPNNFTHYIFEFTDGSKLFFNDLRKFGWVRLVNREQVVKLVSEFGVGPLTTRFTLLRFKEILKKYPARKIKQILMDQALIAGIGNIYADESCFCARVKPSREVKSLEEKEVRTLFNCIPRILKFAIIKKGTSDNTYVRPDGSRGGMVPYLKVYGCRGEKCKCCGSKIVKIKLNGRGTHFCPNCQK